MENFTIHIFGYGETQINSKDLTIKVKTEKLNSVQSIIDKVFSKKPNDNPTLVTDFHAINLFGYNDARWQSKDSFNNNNDSDLAPLIDELISELQKVKYNLQIESQKK
jgi:hypothetical protein